MKYALIAAILAGVFASHAVADDQTVVGGNVFTFNVGTTPGGFNFASGRLDVEGLTLSQNGIGESMVILQTFSTGALPFVPNALVITSANVQGVANTVVGPNGTTSEVQSSTNVSAVGINGATANVGAGVILRSQGFSFNFGR